MKEVRLSARFDYRQTPSWINLLQVERQRVKYSDIFPSLKRLGVVKNNSGSKRMFIFNQTPNGKLTVIFYHEPHPDDGRGMEDPCYVTPLVDGFMRSGYVW